MVRRCDSTKYTVDGTMVRWCDDTMDKRYYGIGRIYFNFLEVNFKNDY
jgi:hypothetical protein